MTESCALTDQAQDAGDMDEERIAAVVASSIPNVGQQVINLAAAGTADCETWSG